VDLSGQVIDALSLEPISAAQISLDNGQTALTDLNGIYTLTITPGLYTVTAQAEGYFSQTIAALSLLTDTIQDFALQPLVCPAPVILGLDYSADGLTVTFTATVTSTLPLDYLWSFGDGLTGTLPGPVHTYAGYGDYHVSLEVGNACGPAYGSLELAIGRRSYLPIMTRP
jgi:PKD repeat protein